MYAGFLEEDDMCPNCNEGTLLYEREGSCSCHINPPCSSCTDQKLTCNKCSWQDDPPVYKEIPVAEGVSLREYKPKPLDSTKIDYRVKSHTHFSMIKEGVYPEGTSMEEVRKVVNGTFGGRFEYFEGGKFKFIAYTD